MSLVSISAASEVSTALPNASAPLIGSADRVVHGYVHRTRVRSLITEGTPSPKNDCQAPNHTPLSLCRCRGQCYDGASSMSGSKTGVATRLIEEERRAVFVHCFGHALNLAVGDTLKRSTVCKSSLENAYEITKLVKFSPKRNSMFDRIKADVREKDHAEGTGIRSFCPTRWTVRADSIVSILKNYEVLKKLWDECLESKLVPEVKGRIIGVKAQMSTYDMLFGLKLSEKILKLTDNLSRTLQKQTLSAAEGHSVAKMTIKTLKALRTNEHFAAFF